MKQNERLLVYAVTGFLALILVVAVLFSREPEKGEQGAKATQGLDDILGDGGKGDGKVATEKAAADANKTGLPAPGDVSPTPLAAPAPKALVAADLVAQQLGVSRRDRNVRFVRAKQNDSLDVLVRRWCGARDPYLAEAKSLNEELVVLNVGQEVAVPWVDDEIVLAAIEAQKPKTLMAQDAVAGTGTGTPANATAGGAGQVQPTAAPSFQQPGNGVAGESSGPRSEKAPAVAVTNYTVKDKDSLWKIAERTYGKKLATRMVEEIKAANPGLGEDIKIGQKIKLPAAPTGA